MLKQLLKNKKIALSVAIFTLISAIVIMMAIWNHIRISSQRTSAETQVDQASGDSLAVGTGGGVGGQKQEVLTLGIDNLLKRGMQSKAVKDSTDMIKYYGEKNNIKIERISYYKNSYSKISTDPTTFKFKIALNTDQKDLWEKVIVKGVSNYELYLYEDEKMENQVGEFKYCDINICSTSTPTPHSELNTNEAN
ncbi:MAG: hypothetical protein Q4A27_01445 [bacterium]|nr:hypothetical protein [bacterium]